MSHQHTPAEEKYHADLGGHQRIYRFANGYGASVVRHRFSYGGSDGKWELAVIRFDGPGHENWGFAYGTGITDDVLGWLDDEQVTGYLDQIEQLNPPT